MGLAILEDPPLGDRKGRKRRGNPRPLVLEDPLFSAKPGQRLVEWVLGRGRSFLRGR